MLRVLGGLELAGHAFHRLKPLLLLAYLALEGPKARRHLAELFWPEAQDPLNSLSVALTQLKPLGVLEGGEVLRVRVSTDLEALRQALREGNLEEARRLYRGTVLQGVELPLGEELEEWVWTNRERVALEVYQAFAAQARAFYLLGGRGPKGGRLGPPGRPLGPGGGLEPGGPFGFDPGRVQPGRRAFRPGGGASPGGRGSGAAGGCP